MPSGIVVIGASLGGLHAVETLLGGLPASFPRPVAIVQHREAGSDDRLSELLQSHTALPVAEVEDKEPITPGRVYLAPADYHLLIENGNFALSTEPPVWHARPSIDVLFESAAEARGARVIGVILSGANQDGARGLAAVKRCGGIAVVQDPATAESSAMPNAAIATAETDQILPLEEIASFVARVVSLWHGLPARGFTGKMPVPQSGFADPPYSRGVNMSATGGFIEPTLLSLLKT